MISNSTFEWYESQQGGLGDEFLSAVRERLETLRDFPESAPVLYRDTRRAVVSRMGILRTESVESWKVLLDRDAQLQPPDS